MKKVILLGDSIRQGYEKYVKLAFEGRVNIYSPQDCCRFSSYLLRCLTQWKVEMDCGNDVDLVHWNAGLWDCLLMPDGERHTDIEVYGKYLQRIHAVLKRIFPEAKQVFATSTAVLEERYVGYYRRFNRDIEAYNAMAIKVLEPLGVQINDLYDLTKDIPEEYHSDMTHFNTKEGARLLADQVISCIEDNLDVQASPVDYDSLFAKQTDIVGL